MRRMSFHMMELALRIYKVKFQKTLVARANFFVEFAISVAVFGSDEIVETLPEDRFLRRRSGHRKDGGVNPLQRAVAVDDLYAFRVGLDDRTKRLRNLFALSLGPFAVLDV